MSVAEREAPLLVFRKDRSYFRRIALAVAALWGAGLLVVVFDGDLCIEKNLWAIAVLGLGLWPGLRTLHRGDIDVFPVFELHALFYGICFGASSLLISEQISKVSLDERTLALKASLAGVLALYYGFFVAGPFFFGSTRPLRLENRVPYDSLLKHFWWVASIYAVYRNWHGILGGLDSVIVQPFHYIGWMSLAFVGADLLTAPKARGSSLTAFAVLMALMMVAAVASAALSQIADIVVFLTFIVLNVRKTLLLKSFAVFIVLFVLLNPVKMKMRDATWSDPNGQSLSTFEKAKLFAELMASEGLSPVSRDGYNAFETIVTRTDHAGLLAEVMSQTPDSVPYANGITYLPMLTVWIPRVIWADKPKETLGNDWAHWYSGLLNADDTTTSLNLPWLVEFYVNFGWEGILVGMFLVGLLYAWLVRRLCFREAGTLEYAASMSLLLGFWFAESNLSLFVGGLILGSISLAIYMRFAFTFTKLKRSRS